MVQCLETVVLYIWSGFLASHGGRASPLAISPLWVEGGVN